MEEKRIDSVIMDQRKGRTGRTCDGLYIPLVSKKEYELIKVSYNEVEAYNEDPTILIYYIIIISVVLF